MQLSYEQTSYFYSIVGIRCISRIINQIKNWDRINSSHSNDTELHIVRGFSYHNPTYSFVSFFLTEERAYVRRSVALK